MATCAICWNTATASALRGHDGGLRAAKVYQCAICGTFEITDHQEVNGRSLSADQRYLLSAITRNATEEGRTVELTTKSTERLLDTTRWPTPTQQNMLFLGYIERKAAKRGDAVPVNHKTDYPLFFAKGEEEVNSIARDLLSSGRGGFIKRTDTSALPHYRLTMEAYEELERTRATPVTPHAPGRPPDALTGLSDRGTFDIDLAAAVDLALKSGSPLALVWMDTDNFKKINDKHTHAKGDDVLRGLAQRLQGATAYKGTTYRWGGDEMAAILPNHSLNEAVAVAERIRLAVSGSPIAGIAVTVSVGVAVHPDHAADGEALCKAADTAAYDAKRLGRDLVRWPNAPEPTPVPELAAVAVKQPQGNQLPDGWAESAQRAHFQGKVVICPRDGARMKAQETSGIGEAGGVFFYCGLCGLEVNIKGRPV